MVRSEGKELTSRGAFRGAGRPQLGGPKNSTEQSCPLCQQEDVILRNDYAYVRRDNFQLSRGHVLVVPIRHVAGYFDMTLEEKHAVTPFGKFSGARRRCLVLNLISPAWCVRSNNGPA